MSRGSKIKNEERKFDVGDQVLAKVRGYSFWPACVSRIVSKAQYEVTFYGTKQKSVVNKDFIVHYSLENVKKYIKMPQNIESAIFEIEAAIRKKKEEEKGVKKFKVDDFTLKHISVEIEILEVCSCIRKSLLLCHQFDFKKCAEALDRAKKISFTTLMIKKRPEFVEVLDKVSRLRTRELKPRECQSLRTKAAKVLDQIRILFGVSKETNFLKFFDLEMKIFKDKVKDLNEFEFNSLANLNRLNP